MAHWTITLEREGAAVVIRARATTLTLPTGSTRGSVETDLPLLLEAEDLPEGRPIDHAGAFARASGNHAFLLSNRDFCPCPCSLSVYLKHSSRYWVSDMSDICPINVHYLLGILSTHLRSWGAREGGAISDGPKGRSLSAENAVVTAGTAGVRAPKMRW